MLTSFQGHMGFPHGAQTTEKYPLSRWEQGDDGPWHPAGLTSSTGNSVGQSIAPGMRHGPFLVPGQSRVVPSVTMQHSDSGYVSCGNRPSIADGSICDDSFDANSDPQSVMGRPMGVPMVEAPFSISHVIPNDANSRDPWLPQLGMDTGLWCEVCKKELRTRSEQKKHQQRHKKPFRCDFRDCPRQKEGFSTTNDLDRHKRSKHPESETLGNRYVCRIGACKSKDKIWPRADNFRAHLKRMHKQDRVSDEALTHHLYKPSTQPDEPRDAPQEELISDFSEYPSSASGTTTTWTGFSEAPHGIEPLNRPQTQEYPSSLRSRQELADLRIHHMPLAQGLYHETAEPGLASHSPIASSSPADQSRSPQESGAPETSLASHREHTAQIPRDYYVQTPVVSIEAPKPPLSDESNESNESTSRHSTTDGSPDYPVKADDGTLGSVEPEPVLVDSAECSGLDISSLNFKDTHVMKKLVDALQTNGLLKQFGFKKENQGTAEPIGITTDAVMDKNQTHPFPCAHCNKSFPRNCELRKHEQRHKRPYGCTTPNCNKRFGSKNDWKRHENTQHSMLEIWKCEEGGLDQVEKAYRIYDQNKLEDKLEGRRVGQNCEVRFWCGFCQDIIEIKKMVLEARTERFDHIDDHICGRNGKQKRAISEWENFTSPGRSEGSPGEDSYGDYCPPRNYLARYSGQDGTQPSSTSLKSKRKRIDGNHDGNSKKSRIGTGLICCECGDLVIGSQTRCHYPCEHTPCDNCNSC